MMSSLRTIAHNSHDARAGFTLLEMLVVLTIMAVLTTIAVQSLEPVAQKSRIEATERTLDTVQKSLLTVTQTAGSTSISGFMADMRRLPTTLAELSVNTTSDPHWQGPYLTAPANSPILFDGWNRSPRITFADSTGTSKMALDNLQDLLLISSDGLDGVPATADDVVRRLPVSQLTARDLRVRLYAVDAQGHAVDISSISSTTPTVTISTPAAAGTPQATVVEGMDRVYTLTAAPGASPPVWLTGCYAIVVDNVTPAASVAGTVYEPTIRVNVLPGSSQTVDILIFRAAATGTGTGTGTGDSGAASGS
ncbi:MAG: hypothetical protein C0483_19305 [Pirellula sp.]|nr:hypothetical protein [Pirellula sp.]